MLSRCCVGEVLLAGGSRGRLESRVVRGVWKEEVCGGELGRVGRVGGVPVWKTGNWEQSPDSVHRTGSAALCARGGLHAAATRRGGGGREGCPRLSSPTATQPIGVAERSHRFTEHLS